MSTAGAGATSARPSAASNGAPAAPADAARPEASPAAAPATRSPVQGFVYKTKFKMWESRAAVRAKPRRVLDDEREAGKLFFPPELVPVASHPLVRERGGDVVDEILLQRLHVYLDFTAELEQMAVNPVTQRISRKKLGFEIPDAMAFDAYKICTDESWHAQFSDDLQRQIVDATGVAPRAHAEPQFFQRLEAMEAGAPPEIKGLPSVFFTIVSETLISAILSDIPHDARVVSAVRELVADHAEDEGRHHAFFAQLFGCVWPQLSKTERRLVGRLLPQLVLAFLEPDYSALATVLGRSGLSDDEVRGVIEESHPRKDVVAAISQDAKATLRLFRQYGVFDDPETRDAFLEAGLIQV